jgi:hypothetical protein
MFDRIIKSLESVPEHLIALVMIAAGSVIALIPHLAHAYETGSALTASGLAMYRGKLTSAE